MPCQTARLTEQGLITPPAWLPNNVMFEAMSGSVAYGCETPGNSDIDLVGFAVPPKHMVFPHLDGHIPGFGPAPPRFDVYQQHHIHDPSDQQSYDIAMYGLVRYLHLCAENNPNMVDVLFSPRRCIRHSTALSEHIRDHRRMFLHKGAYHRFRGYAYAQLKKLDKARGSKTRQADIDAHGFDTKFAYHIVRLACECEQILVSGDLVLDRDRELYKGIRRGEWDLTRIRDWFGEKERHLEDLYHHSTLPEQADLEGIKTLLIECLEMHYGSLQQAVAQRPREDKLVDGLLTAILAYDPSLLARGRETASNTEG